MELRAFEDESTVRHNDQKFHRRLVFALTEWDKDRTVLRVSCEGWDPAETFTSHAKQKNLVLCLQSENVFVGERTYVSQRERVYAPERENA